MCCVPALALWRVNDFVDEVDSATRAGRVHEAFDPFDVELWRLNVVECEAQRDRWVQPDRRPTGRVSVGVSPGEREALVAAKFCGDDYFEVRERAVVDVDFIAAAVLDRSHI